MTLRLMASIALSLVATTMTASAVSAQSIKLIPTGKFPAAVTVSVLDTPKDNTPRPIEPAADGTWIITVARDPSAWRNEPTILIKVPARARAVDGVSSDAVTLQLDFSFKATDAESQIDVPIEIFSVFGTKELDRVEAMARFQRYEQIFLAQSLARHYLSRLGNPEDALTQRTVQLWFDAIYTAAADSEESRPLRLGSDIQRIIKQVFPNRVGYFATLTAQLRQRFWRDKDDLDDLLAEPEPDCTIGDNLVKDLERRHAAHPEDAAPGAASVGEPEQVLADLAQRAADCN